MSLLALLLFSSAASAALTATSPGPNEKYRAGSTCTIKWSVDTTNIWNNVTIDLMSGPNLNMSQVTTVVRHIDGTNSRLTSFNWTCPEVDPYSNIYFYQLSNNADTANSVWTARFTIESPSGESTPAEHTEQPGGAPIPWGTGHLAGSSRVSGAEGDGSAGSYPPPTHTRRRKVRETAISAINGAPDSSSTESDQGRHHSGRAKDTTETNVTHKNDDYSGAFPPEQGAFSRSVPPHTEGRPTSRGSIRGASSSIYILCTFSAIWLTL
ncbi:hypothetical protein BV22DRAFT_1194087 [Leucogyrophana mollusca]|uniref:Uncharacterized protein n=1 Tax=Leucogyrophana mollusca TaxID=85980 RepID=A0ACB8BQC2_9AGAM|nr:hypothetical protein BV22DRAFT_1194087 [Leucogyrophana mollusca]